MPHKDPDLIYRVIIVICENPTLQGVLTAALTAFLRSIYFGEKKWRKVFLETFLCGVLSLMANGAVDLLEALLSIQLPDTVIVTLCSIIGLIGVTSIREYVLKKMNKDVDIKSKRPRRYEENDDDL